MTRSLGLVGIAALAASIILASGAALAFNPQPDPPGKLRFVGPNTVGAKGGSKSLPGLPMKGGSKSLPGLPMKRR
jgi:hypothetical protein